MQGLVDYASSDDDEAKEEPVDQPVAVGSEVATSSKRPADDQAQESSKKARRALPKLTFDDEASRQPNEQEQHHPHVVRGDWLGHVYLPLPLDSCTRLESLLGKMRRFLDKERPDIHHLLSREADEERQDSGGEEELHISLTQPILVRAQERPTFVRIARDALVSVPSSTHSTSSSLSLGFSRLVLLPSSTTARAFFALEVSQGHEQLQALSGRLDEQLRAAFRAREYRWPEGTRWHASFAWCSTLEEGDGEGDRTSLKRMEELHRLTDKLEEKFGDQLRSAVGSLRVSSACVRMGGKVHVVPMSRLS